MREKRTGKSGRTNDTGRESSASLSRRWVVPAVLIACITVVGFWEVMANRSRNPFRPFNLTGESFAGFLPSAAGWSFQSVPVTSSPLEPNILAFKVRKQGGVGLVGYRLVHGYNMHDCMRIKGYTVELIEESGKWAESGKRKAEGEEVTASRNRTLAYDVKYSVNGPSYGSNASFSQVSGFPPSLKELWRAGRSQPSLQPFLRVQVWRLTSGAGDVSIWVTSMLKAGDFSFLDMDVRSMPFPRVGVPDDPGWVPRGFTLAGLKHPVRNLRLFLRAKWNGARCDVATFLKLKTPAWADDEILTAVSVLDGQVVRSENEADLVNQVVDVQVLMQSQLSAWRLGVSIEDGGNPPP